MESHKSHKQPGHIEAAGIQAVLLLCTVLFLMEAAAALKEVNFGYSPYLKTKEIESGMTI